MKKKIIELKSRHFILVGDESTWKVALEHTQWGFSEKNIGLWRTTNENDLILFYVTAPIKKIIGFGIITNKFINDDVFWPDEKLFKKSIWKYRIKFHITYLIKNWKHGIPIPTTIMLNIGRKVIEKEVYAKFLKDAEIKWRIKNSNPDKT